MPTVVTYSGALGDQSPIYFTRASTATYFNSAGVLTTAATNSRRIDYNPSTLVKLGMLIEEARTNILLRSTLAGATAGSPGTAPTGWTATAVGTPTLSLPTSIYGASDQALSFSGATGDRLFHSQTINVVDGTTYVYSAYCEASSGSPGTVLSVISGTSTSTAISSTAVNPTGGSGVRVQVVFSVVGTGTVTVRMGAGVSTGLVAAGSVTLSRPQVEAGAFATSVIPTTTTALTRAADVASVNTLSPWYNAVEGTIYFEGGIPSDYSAGFPTFYSLNDATANNNIQPAVNASANVINMEMKVSGSAVAGFFPAYVSGTTKLAFAYKLNDVNYAKDGVAGVTDTSAAVPAVSQLNLGSNQTPSNFLNGYLRRITYYPRRLSNAELQALTT